ncbi:hypothetical protein AB0J28_50150, partial [Streptosporangium canum]
MSREKATTVNASVISGDGTGIAFERLGAGPAVILVSSALADRSDTRKPLEAGRWSAATAPPLVLTGSKSPAGFHDAARALAHVLPEAEHRTLPGL